MLGPLSIFRQRVLAVVGSVIFRRNANNIVLHAAAEAGVVAGAAVAVIAMLLALRYLRGKQGPSGLRQSGDPATAAAFLLVLPYFVFDAFPYVFPVGLFLTALWFGLLERSRQP